MSAEAKGASPTLYTYSLSAHTLGQYISRTASKVVGSAMPMPMFAAMRRAQGSYSSAVMVRSVGTSTRSLGALGACLRVEYTQ